MPHPVLHPYTPFSAAGRTSGAQRTFVDDDGRAWTVVGFPMAAGRATGDERSPGLAVVFTCTSDARLAQRATGAPADTQLLNVPEATLRAWLAHAPRLGRLT